jgi:hypothetical protein
VTRRAPINVFWRSWRLLNRNPVIVVPGFLAAGVGAFLTVLLEPSSDPTSPAALSSSLVTRTLALWAGTIVTTIVAIAFTTGMADAAWRTPEQRCTLRDGARALRSEGRHVFIAFLALAVLGLIAAVLSAYTLGLSIAAYAFCCIYTMPAAVVGARPGLAAIVESVRIAYRKPWVTLAIVAVILGVALVMGFVALLISNAPYVGGILESLVVQCVIAYTMLIVVGEYDIAQRLEGVV